MNIIQIIKKQNLYLHQSPCKYWTGHTTQCNSIS